MLFIFKEIHAQTEDDGQKLLPGSPSIDAGNNSATAADVLDLDDDEEFDELLKILD